MRQPPSAGMTWRQLQQKWTDLYGVAGGGIVQIKDTNSPVHCCTGFVGSSSLSVRKNVAVPANATDGGGKPPPMDGIDPTPPVNLCGLTGDLSIALTSNAGACRSQ